MLFIPKLLILLSITNIVVADPIIVNDYDDDTDVNYNFVINFYNNSNCSDNYIKSLSYYHSCDVNSHETCCQNIMEYFDLNNKYNLTEECLLNDDYYTTYECIELDNKNDFTLIFTIFYSIFSIFFIILIYYCYKRRQKEKNNKEDLELEEQKPLSKNIFEAYTFSHLNR